MATARKLFGTDGVRGEAGTFLTAELATALGPRRHRLAGGRAAAGPDRARHARVGADARGGPGRRDRRRRRRRAARRRAADPGGGDPGQAPRPRPCRGRLRLAQPLPRQRDQVLLGAQGYQARRRGRGADRVAARERAAGEARARQRARAERRPRGLPAGAASPPSRSISPAAGWCSTAPTAPPSGRSGDLRAARGRRSRRSRPSPTGATSTTAAARPTSTRSPTPSPPRRRRSASPSTATATGCSPSTAPGAATTATS